MKKLRCAVYTRKSSEEGLDQAFNSLDAQREACAAYVASQVGLGWKLVVDRYDDGGISGGTMERPGLIRLLADISACKIDVVVVYKIDRLTRSLADFAKIVEVFDGNDVSFVSVTQQFNTTTSMGRLMLNVLLSFAQFEREVTAERIRDKIAASKKKGMWMGGRVPLGYRVENRKLKINEPEASFVRHLFVRYLELSSVPALAAEVTRLADAASRNDENSPSSPLQAYTRRCRAGMLYNLLSNPIYIGKLKHKDSVHDGEHEAIIDSEQFACVQRRLAEQAATPRGSSAHADVHLLTGLLFDDSGDRMSPTHARAHGRRYRYYISSRIKGARKANATPWRVPAPEPEQMVTRFVSRLLQDKAQLAKWIVSVAPAVDIERCLDTAARLQTRFVSDHASDQRELLQALFPRIELGQHALRFVIDVPALIAWLAENPTRNGTATSFDGEDTDHADRLVSLDLPVAIKRRGNEMRLIIAGDRSCQKLDAALVTLIARAHLYLRQLTSAPNISVRDVAKANAVHHSDVSRILPLAFLAPDLTDQILTGRQPAELSARQLARQDLPMLWADQLNALS